MADGWIVGAYNALNQPVAMGSFVYWGTPNWVYFGFDPLGRCVKRWISPSSDPASNPATYFYYDGWSLIQEGAGASASSAQRLYIHGGRVDEIVKSINYGSGQSAFHHYDARGHCTLLTNTSGTILEQYDYDAFGWPYFYTAGGLPMTVNGQPGSIHGNRFLFTGREWLSDLKLYDYRNRMYQPELGRFLQPDPKEFGAGDYNLYRYCHNDPINNFDPLGLLILKFDATYPTSDQARVTAAFNLGASTERGAALNADKRTFFIHPTDYKHPTGQVGNKIYLNPSDRLFLDPESRKLYEKKYHNELPPQDEKGRAIQVWHEIGHFVTGEHDEDKGGQNVHMNENPIRRQLVVTYRLQYSGTSITGNPENPPWEKEKFSNLVRPH